MRIVYVLLIIGVTLGVALLTVSFVHPGGLSGLQEDLLGESDDAGTGSRGGTGENGTRNGSSATTGKELQNGHVAYDRGDFDYAVTMYKAARSFAIGEADRGTARQALDRALLANALVMGSPRVSETGDAARAEFDRLKQAAEARPTEQAWLAAARYGKGAGIESGLVYVVERCLDAAQSGGPVENVLRQSAGAGRRGRALSLAIKARGLNGEPLVAVASGGTGTAQDPDIEGWDESDDETVPSGIGGVGRAKVQRVPFGAFSGPMRERMKRAVELEAKGEDEWRAATPGKPDRAAHRKKGLEYLREARSIYSDALEEDPKAIGLERRLQSVTRMLYELRKDATIND